MHCRADEGILAVTAGGTSGVQEFFRGKPLRVMDLAEILSLQRDRDVEGLAAPKRNSEIRPRAPIAGFSHNAPLRSLAISRQGYFD